MILRRIATAVVFTASVAMTVQTGVANADVTTNDVKVSVAPEAGGLGVNLLGGRFMASADATQLGIADAAGHVGAAIPLSFDFRGEAQKLVTQVSADGTHATILPQLGAVAKGLITNVGTPVEVERARGDLLQQIDLAVRFGAPGGTIVGVLVGAGIGCIIGLIIGCAPGIAIGGAIGAAAGTLIAGGPAIQGAWSDYNAAVSAAPCTTKYAVYDVLGCPR